MVERVSSLAAFTCLLIVLCGHTSAGAAVDCRITTARPARTFYSGEDACLNITAMIPDQDVPYQVRDFSGATVAQGSLRLSETRPEVLQLTAPENGVYYLTLTFSDQDVVHDAFCVIPRPDADAGDPGLWGFQFGAMAEDYFTIMAQAGVRYLRFDLSWPDHEPNQGEYNTGKADWYADALRDCGLQMIPTLGYTAPWTALQPEDMPAERAHTWCPEAVEHWGDYIALMRDRLASRTVTFPSPRIVPAGNAGQTVPLVRSWEIWNEVDQNFYYGPWSRYLDLLRIAGKTLKQHSLEDKVIYGGACGHWTELGKTYGVSGELYFDQIAWHSNGDIEQELPKYYYGCPQLGYHYECPRPTVQTECYPDTMAGVGEAEYLLRLYATLKAWREEGYCYAAIGGHLVGDADPNSSALAYQDAVGNFIPNAKYVAYAVTRWLLADTAYLGPLNLGDGIIAQLFAKQGKALLIAWADNGAAVSVDTAPGAVRMDIMGRKRAIAGPQCSLALTGAPSVVYGVAESYIPQAIHNYFELCMNTEYGFNYPVDSPYLKTLGWDCNWGVGDQVGRMRATLQTALQAMSDAPIAKARKLNTLATDIRLSMTNLADAAYNYGIVRPEIPTSVWRLEKLAEWLGEATDALRDTSRGVGADASATPETQGLSRYLEECRGKVADHGRGTVHPLSEALLERGFRMAETFQRTRGRGAYLAAMTAAAAGTAYVKIEPEALSGIFAVGYFPTAHQMKKGMLFNPGQTHTLGAQVWNFTDSAVSGTLTWSLPGTWSPSDPSVPFTAPAHSHTDRITTQVQIPGEPQPWVLKWTSTPAGRFCVSIPDPLASEATLVLGGTLSDGRQLLPMEHEVCVGTWVPGGNAG